jgi:hypothetical protein
MNGERPPAAPRPLIAASWRRVRRRGLGPEGGRLPDVGSRDEVERRREESGLTQVVDILRAGLLSFADDGVHIMVITDAEGSVLWREGSTAVCAKAESMGLTEGARWDENSVGTTGIGTAQVVRRPLQVFAAEHFVRTHHPWICTASPLRDPVDGRLLGVVDVSGPAVTAHPSTLALVTSVAQLAERSLHAAHGDEVERLRAVSAPVLARMRGPALVTDRNGWVAAATEILPPDRVLLPDGRLYGGAHVPSIGWCQIEPIFDGWLIRPDPDEPDPPTTVRIDLRGKVPYVVVDAPSGHWRHRLSPRHAEILLVLARCPAGRSAAELSADLFGDPTRTVTVRAELSRLRRRLGSLISQRPYRFAPGLEIGCDLPDDSAALLPTSTAPAIAKLRADPSFTRAAMPMQVAG